MTSEIPLVHLAPLTFTQQFSSTRCGAHLARLAATRQLAAWGWTPETEASQTAALLVAELAANAALHGRLPGRDFRLRLHLAASVGPTAPATLRIEVADSRGERPVARAAAFPTPTAESGRGLVLVDALAARWGTEPRQPSGKTVWADLVLG
jgi:anti-sigma regulatory factor (Ser/Thr protein kinase)